MDKLERRYRRLLRAYPAGYREERADEIVGTFLDGARPGRTRPTVGDAADVVVAGLRTRFGSLRAGDVGLGLRTAAPVALAVAAGLAVLGLLRDSQATAGHPAPFQPALFAYAAWLLAAVGRIALPRVVARVLAGAALLGTLVVLTLLPGTWSSPSPGWSLVVLTLLGAVAVAGGGPRLSTRERGALAAGSAVAVAVFGGSALLVSTVDSSAWFGPGWVMNGYRSTVEAVVAVALVVLLAGLAVLGRYRDRRWWAAASTLLVATGWLLVPSAGGADTRVVPGVLVALSVGAAIWYRRRGDRSRPFAVPATLALGCAAGLAGATLLARPSGVGLCFGDPAGASWVCQEPQRWITQGRPAYLVWLVALVAWAVLPRVVARVLVAAAVVATPAVLWPDQVSHPAPDNVVPMTLSLLGLVALLGSAGPIRRSERWGVLAAAAATAAVPLLIGFAVGPGFTFIMVGPLFALAFVPLTVALVSGWRVARHGSGARRLIAAGLIALSAAWLVVLAFDVVAYRLAAVVLAAAALLATLVLRLRPLHDQGVPHVALTT